MVSVGGLRQCAASGTTNRWFLSRDLLASGQLDLRPVHGFSSSIFCKSKYGGIVACPVARLQARDDESATECPAEVGSGSKRIKMGVNRRKPEAIAMKLRQVEALRKLETPRRLRTESRFSAY